MCCSRSCYARSFEDQAPDSPEVNMGDYFIAMSRMLSIKYVGNIMEAMFHCHS